MRIAAVVCCAFLVGAIVSAAPHPALAAEACATTATPTATLYLPNITKTLGGPDGWVTPIVVQNEGAAVTRIEMSFYRFVDGAAVACHVVPVLLAHAATADIPNDDADLPDDTQFSVVVRSYGTQIAAIANESRTGEAASYEGSATGTQRVFLPNVTRRYYGFDTPFIVQNVGTAPATAVAAFTSFDGTRHLAVSLALAPGRAKAVDPNYTPGLTDATQYSVTITSDQPVVAVVNTVNLDVPMASSYRGLTTGAATLFAPYFVRGMPREGSSPIVVMNVGAAPTQPKLTVVYASGPYFCDTASCPQNQFAPRVLQPGQTMVFDPRDLDVVEPAQAGAILTALVPGTTTPDPNALLAAVVLPTSATTSMGYQARSPTQLESYFFPNVVKGLGGTGGWTTRLAILSDTYLQFEGEFIDFSTGQQVGSGGFFGSTSLLKSNPDGSPMLVPGVTTVDPWTWSLVSPDAQYSVVMTPYCHPSSDTTVFPQAHVFAVAIETADGGDNEMIYEGAAGARTTLFTPTKTGPCP